MQKGWVPHFSRLLREVGLSLGFKRPEMTRNVHLIVLPPCLQFAHTSSREPAPLREPKATATELRRGEGCGCPISRVFCEKWGPSRIRENLELSRENQATRPVQSCWRAKSKIQSRPAWARSISASAAMPTDARSTAPSAKENFCRPHSAPSVTTTSWAIHLWKWSSSAPPGSSASDQA
jgi:hypothetical protein